MDKILAKTIKNGINYAEQDIVIDFILNKLSFKQTNELKKFCMNIEGFKEAYKETENEIIFDYKNNFL